MQQESNPPAFTGTESPAPASAEQPAAGNSRRALLAGAGLVGLAGVVAACGGSDTGTAGAPAGTGASSASGGGATSGGTSSGGASSGGSAALAKTSDIPVGGGKIFADQKIVVTQPVRGTFKAFSATCTHRGCTVGSVADGTIDCPCHGSKFKISDGSVANGPAQKSLAAKQVVVQGDEINLA
jgi:Rieske Fe-S protein